MSIYHLVVIVGTIAIFAALHIAGLIEFVLLTIAGVLFVLALFLALFAVMTVYIYSACRTWCDIVDFFFRKEEQ